MHITDRIKYLFLKILVFVICDLLLKYNIQKILILSYTYLFQSLSETKKKHKKSDTIFQIMENINRNQTIMQDMI